MHTAIAVPAKRTALAACVGAAFALFAPATYATTWPVTSCADHGTGTLRDVISTKALSGDIIDMTGTQCSVISLTTGAIGIDQQKLTLQGPSTRMTISGKYNGAKEVDRVINHTAFGGTLYLNNLNVVYGAPYSATAIVRGGCIYSKGDVYLDHSSVSNCTAKVKDFGATGGGIYTRGNLSATSSSIASNYAGSMTSQGGRGAGAYTQGALTLTNSIVTANFANGTLAGGGGVVSRGTVLIQGSTISNNDSYHDVGGLWIRGNASNPFASIINSTISGNAAIKGSVGGLQSEIPITLQNSTVAFNRAYQGTTNDGAGLALYAFTGSITAHLQSSVLSNNCFVANCLIQNDLSTQTKGTYTVTISGANNLIYSTPVTLPPGVAQTGLCPLLGPLRDNGGPTKTHALFSHSPAIDAGNNLSPVAFDQRGSPYLRASGPQGTPNPVADIGAYEVQQDDIIFNASFEGCP